MSTTKLRNKVYKKLESVDDSVLEEVLRLIEFETDEGVFHLSDAQKSAIDESRQQIKDGNSFTNQEVGEEIDIWLKNV